MRPLANTHLLTLADFLKTHYNGKLLNVDAYNLGSPVPSPNHDIAIYTFHNFPDLNVDPPLDLKLSPDLDPDVDISPAFRLFVFRFLFSRKDAAFRPRFPPVRLNDLVDSWMFVSSHAAGGGGRGY